MTAAGDSRTALIVLSVALVTAVSVAAFAYYKSNKRESSYQAADGSLLCSECKKFKPRAAFAKSQFKKKRLHLRCLECTFHEAGSSTSKPTSTSTSTPTSTATAAATAMATATVSSKTTPLATKACDKADFVAVFTEIRRELEYALMHIAQAVQLAKLQNPSMSAADLNSLMSVDIQRCTEEISAEVQDKHGVTESMLQKCVEENMNDTDMTNQLRQLELLIQNPGRPCPVPSNLTKKKVLEICKRTHSSTIDAIKRQIAAAQKQGQELTKEEVVNDILKRAQEDVESQKDALHADFGMGHSAEHRPEVILQSAITKFERDAGFAKTMQQLQNAQQQQTEAVWKRALA